MRKTRCQDVSYSKLQELLQLALLQAQMTMKTFSTGRNAHS